MDARLWSDERQPKIIRKERDESEKFLPFLRMEIVEGQDERDER